MLRRAAVLVLAGCATVRPATQYRAGDWVAYRYSGSFTDEPVELREEIESQEGLRLHILVTARRGAEKRQWVQVVTDTPENQKSERIDALYEVRDDGRVRLANQGNQDLYHLYQWTLPPQLGAPVESRRVKEEQTFAGATFQCELERGRFASGEAFAFATCPAFRWTNGPAEILRGGEVVWRREVVTFGGR